MKRKPVSRRVIQKVANSTDSDVLELPPLYDAIDPGALEKIVEGMSDGEVTFAYARREVTVTSDGTIDLVEQSGSYSPAANAEADD